MSKRGLVVRGPVPGDGRGYRAVLTATGLETLRRPAPGHAASVRRIIFGTINDDELSCIASSLKVHLRGPAVRP